MKNCSLRDGLMMEKFVEDCFLWEGPHTGAREECEEFCRESEQQRQHDELTARGGRKFEDEVVLGKKEGVWERHFQIWF